GNNRYSKSAPAPPNPPNARSGRDRQAGPGMSRDWRRDTADRRFCRWSRRTRLAAAARWRRARKRAVRRRPETGRSARATGPVAVETESRCGWRRAVTGWPGQEPEDGPAAPGELADSG